MRERIVRGATFLTGLFYLVTAVIMLAAPEWFYANVGHWPPYNRHYVGDVGAFLLVPGMGLLAAARAPRLGDPLPRLLIGVTLLASAVHTLNHAADLLGAHAGLTHWLVDLGPLVLLLVALAAAHVTARRYGVK